MAVSHTSHMSIALATGSYNSLSYRTGVNDSLEDS